MSLEELPNAVLSAIVYELGPRNTGSLRRTSRGLRESVDGVVKEVQVRLVGLAQLAGLLTKLPALKELSLGSSDEFARRYRSYAELRSHVPCLHEVLAGHTSLESLKISSAAAQQLGALKWARKEAQQAIWSQGASHIQQAGAGQPGPLHKVYWIPDWLATPPNLKRLVIHSVRGLRDGRPTAAQLVCLWLQPKPWASKLSCLEISGMPLPDATAGVLGKLTQLQRLCLKGCYLQASSMDLLLQQLASCHQLTSLALTDSDLWQLPAQGWAGVAGLQELDLSHNVLTALPASLSCLTRLTALHVDHNLLTTLPPELAAAQHLAYFNASHNWLSGCGSSSLSLLAAAWPSLVSLALENVSDKRGALSLPPQLARCRQLTELAVGDNYSLDWDSLVHVVTHCKALRVLKLTGMSKVMPHAWSETVVSAHPGMVVITA